VHERQPQLPFSAFALDALDTERRDATQRCQMAVFTAGFAKFGGFESCLAGKKYFWQTANFWRISGGFYQFCTVLGFFGGFWLFWSLY
jgi:hypothetical protein